MASVAPHAGIIDFGEYIPVSGGQPARPGSLPAPTEAEDGYVFTTDGWTDPNEIGASFESVSKNLRAYDFTLNYTSGELTSVVYSNGVTKTLSYTEGELTAITLSGSTPDGIDLTKTLTYTAGELTAVAYS